MWGRVWDDGVVHIAYDPITGDRLLSPDGLQQLLPCDRCGALKWVANNVASFTCTVCTNELEDGQGVGGGV